MLLVNALLEFHAGYTCEQQVASYPHPQNCDSVNHTGRYLEPLWIPICILTLGFGFFFNLSPNFSLAKVIVFEIIAGIGVGLCFQSPLIALQSLVDPQNITTATATFSFIRNIGCSMSIAIGGVVFQNEMHSRLGLVETTLAETSRTSSRLGLQEQMLAW